MYYPSMIEFLFIISVNCILLHKIYTSVQRSCFHCHRSKAIEFIWGFRGIQSIGRPLMYATRRLQFELLFPEYIPYMSRIFSQLQASRLDDSEDRNCHHVFCNNGFQYIRRTQQCIASQVFYVIVITRAQGMYGIYCTEARGRKPRGLSAIYSMHPECTCNN